jgi:UDPglucose 6-dehydrogenase
MEVELRRISVVGLGKLGAPIAACLAWKGLSTIGLDTNPQIVQAVNRGAAPVYEPGLEDLIQSTQGRVTATEDYQFAVMNSDASFIVVPTPSEDHGGFSLRYVLEAAERIGEVLKKKFEYHVVALTSTVMPGATGTQVKQVLEGCSGKKCGQDFGLCYSPEFVALGSVIRDFLSPDFILIGESDARSGELLADLYKRVCDNDPPVARMTLVNAELTKLAVNTFVTTKISYANMLAQVCERLPGADVDVVTSALGLDSRIGLKYLKGALGYGGPCFPRDNLAFAHLARQLGVEAILAEATDRLNRLQVPRLAEVILDRLPPDGKVGILGLAYKPNTEVVEEAQGFELARCLLSKGIGVVVYDPAVSEKAHYRLNGELTFASSAHECSRQADIVVIATPWDEFRSLSADSLNQRNGRPTLIDCWRILSRDKFGSCANYLTIGAGPSEVP